MFYTFDQNNSGGSFITDDKVCHYVIVEANSHNVANAIAEDIGIYFDGCEAEIDCPCCGDRWYPQWKQDGDIDPLIYGKRPEDSGCMFAINGEVYCRVFYLDGSVKEYRK